MIAAEILTALSTFFIAGCGVTLLLLRGQTRINVLECAALAWLLGTGIISLLLWLGGMLVSGPLLQVATAVIALAVGAWGWSSARKQRLRFSFPRPQNLLEWILCAAITLEIATIFYLSFSRGLDWDGFLNWEVKARYAFQNDGVIPAAYYQSETRAFTHPAYPLLVPLTELWLYLCIGEAHQFWLKIIFPLYYAAGVILLAITGNRLTNRNWPGLLAAALFFFLPFLTEAPGGATGGYVDVPLSVLYLAVVGYLLIYLTNPDASAWRVYASCLALLPWMKREGAILWAVAAVCGAVIICRQRRWFWLLWLTPGALLILSWKIFLLAMRTTEAREFVPMTLPTLWENLPRAFAIFRLIGEEMLTTTRWSFFWPIVLLAFVSLAFRSRDRRLLFLFTAIAAPLTAYAATYLFSFWPDFTDHLRTSYPRLLLQVMPVAWLPIAIAMNKCQPSALIGRD